MKWANIWPFSIHALLKINFPSFAEKKLYLQDKVGREVILAIRPEYIENASFSDNTALTDSLKAVVELVETLGSEIQLDVVSGDHGLVARVHAQTKTKRHPGITLAVDMEKIRIFDKAPPNNRIKTENPFKTAGSKPEKSIFFKEHASYSLFRLCLAAFFKSPVVAGQRLCLV